MIFEIGGDGDRQANPSISHMRVPSGDPAAEDAFQW
jgi:hypothetical protein